MLIQHNHGVFRLYCEAEAIDDYTNDSRDPLKCPPRGPLVSSVVDFPETPKYSGHCYRSRIEDEGQLILDTARNSIQIYTGVSVLWSP